jgi:hypothetical protein
VPPQSISIHQQQQVDGMTTPTPTQIARRIAELQPVRAVMAAAMAAYFQAHTKKIEEIDATREANRKARAEGGKTMPVPAPLPPLGVAATVGLGKSNAVTGIAQAAQDAGLPITILVPNHEIAEEYQQRLANMGAVVYHGRREPAVGTPNGAPVDPGAHACYRIVPIAVAGERNQRPAQGLCSTCPNGMAATLKYVSDPARIERAQQFFQRHGIDAEGVPPCQFLFKGLPDQLAAPILIAPVQAFSEAIGVWREADIESGLTIRQVQRLIVVDEHIDLAHDVAIGAGDIAVWRNRLDGLSERLERRIEFLQAKDATTLTKPETEEIEQACTMRDLIPEIDATFRALASKIAGDISIGADTVRIIDLQKKVSKAGGSTAGTATWEKVIYDREEDGFFIPLRALATLARNCAAGSMRQEKSVLFAYETSPVIEWARDHGGVMFLDATMSQSMRRFIEAKGGAIHHASADQNMWVTRVTGRLYSRGDVKKPDYPAKAKARMQEIRDCIAPQMDKPAAIITHKASLKYSQEAYLSDDAAEIAAQVFQAETGVPIGWFGKHDRGLDAWGGRNIALVGMPLLSKESIAGAYACVRAAMIDCGIPMPEWDRVMDKDKADADGPPMPVMPDVRAWLVDEYAQGLAQAVGRNRAVNHPRGCKPLQVHLWGGLQTAEMDAALRRYGVSVHDRVGNPSSVSGPKVDVGAVDEAISMVLAAGGSVSVRSVRAALVGLRRSASTDAISERIRELRATGVIPAATRVRRDGAADTTESVCAAPANIHVEVVAQLTATTVAVEVAVERHDVFAEPQPQRQGQGKTVGFPSFGAGIATAEQTKTTETTVPNSYKDTNSGNSVQCTSAGEITNQECLLTPALNPFFAPASTPPKAGAFDFASDDAQNTSTLSAHLPTDDEIEAMLAEVAAEIEADLAREEGDPEPDDPGPQGPPGGRRAQRADNLLTTPHAGPAALTHIPYNNPGGGASL